MFTTEDKIELAKFRLTYTNMFDKVNRMEATKEGRGKKYKNTINYYRRKMINADAERTELYLKIVTNKTK